MGADTYACTKISRGTSALPTKMVPSWDHHVHNLADPLIGYMPRNLILSEQHCYGGIYKRRAKYVRSEHPAVCVKKIIQTLQAYTLVRIRSRVYVVHAVGQVLYLWQTDTDWWTRRLETPGDSLWEKDEGKTIAKGMRRYNFLRRGLSNILFYFYFLAAWWNDYAVWARKVRRVMYH